MKKNIGSIDKTIRILVALIIIGLYMAHIISGTLAIVLLVFAVVFIATGFINFCPIYAMLGWSTRKED